MAEGIFPSQKVAQGQSFKIPGFWDRLWIKFTSLFTGGNTKPFEAIADQFSKMGKPWDRPINLANVQRTEAKEAEFKSGIKAIYETPSEKLKELTTTLSSLEKELAQYRSSYEYTYEQEDIAYSYIGSGGTGYDGSRERSELSNKISNTERNIRSTRSDIVQEEDRVAKERGISLPRNHLKQDVKKPFKCIEMLHRIFFQLNGTQAFLLRKRLFSLFHYFSRIMRKKTWNGF